MVAGAIQGLARRLAVPVDPAGFVLFRTGFGLLAAAAALRFVAKGWVEELFLLPTFHFSWLPQAVVPPAPVLYGLFGLQVVAGLGIASGRMVKAWLVLWLASFGYVELLDKALYLNHYVLFTLLGLWLLLCPGDGLRLRGGRPLPTWSLWLLRAQVASVYLWAGIAKLNGDWLLRAEPLATWLQARADLPVVGPLLAQDATAYVMSWGGAAYDLGIPLLLLLPRTRLLGLVLVLGFHLAVGLLFPIGIFPWLMVLAATLFLDPSWPRQVMPGLARTGEAPASPSPASPRPPLSLARTFAWTALVAALFLFPARFLLWGTDVSWTERGHRFAWRVLLNEKTGLVDFRVVEAGTGRTWRVSPSEELTELQHEQLRTQPDLIRDYALHLQQQHAAEGRQVAVFADAWASLNGRSAQRLLSPAVDLTRPLEELQAAGWILPLKASPR